MLRGLSPETPVVAQQLEHAVVRQRVPDPTLPTATSGAAHSAFRTASSVASTVASKTSFRARSGTVNEGASPRGRRPGEANATKISPLP